MADTESRGIHQKNKHIGRWKEADWGNRTIPVRIFNMSANEELYRRIVKAVPEGIWVVSPAGRTIFCNERMAELLDTDVEALERLSCFDSVFPDDLEDAQRQFGRQMAGIGQPFEFRLRRIDGSAIWVNISCMSMYDDGGVCIGLLGLFTDISERVRDERSLRESEELFRAIFSQAAVGITQCSVNGEWLLMNDRFCEMIGYTQAELRGKTVFDITHPDDREACVAGSQPASGRWDPILPTREALSPQRRSQSFG